MKTKFRFLLDYSEIFLVMMIILYWYFSGTLINWVAIIFLAILLGVILTKNTYTGLWISAVISLACMYMFLALLSEFSEFPTHSFDAYRLLIVGFVYIWGTLIVASLMMLKYILQITQPSSS